MDADELQTGQGQALPAAPETQAAEQAAQSAKPPNEAQPRLAGRRGGQRAGTRAEKKNRQMDPLLRFAIKLALLAIIFVCVFTFVLGVHINHGNRMHPFIMDGDLVVTYKLDDYRVGDAVAYRSPLTGEPEVSRIVALGVNTVQITDLGALWINGSMPDENVFYATKPLEGSSMLFPYQMSEGSCFLLDDYRTIGKDSRLFGAIPQDDLLGKIIYIFRRRGI